MLVNFAITYDGHRTPTWFRFEDKRFSSPISFRSWACRAFCDGCLIEPRYDGDEQRAFYVQSEKSILLTDPKHPANNRMIYG